jgi:hypothetical protein
MICYTVASQDVNVNPKLESPRLDSRHSVTEVRRATCHASRDSCYPSKFPVDVDVYKMSLERVGSSNVVEVYYYYIVAKNVIIGSAYRSKRALYPVPS